MQGTRLPDAVMGEPGPGWDAWEREPAEGRPRELLAPLGAYMKVSKEGQHWCWYIRDPTGDASSIRLEHHSVTEFEDGTITVSPSIVVRHGNGWHGWLRRGVWSPA